MGNRPIDEDAWLDDQGVVAPIASLAIKPCSVAISKSLKAELQHVRDLLLRIALAGERLSTVRLP
jgi:hypothetical protein